MSKKKLSVYKQLSGIAFHKAQELIPCIGRAYVDRHDDDDSSENTRIGCLRYLEGQYVGYMEMWRTIDLAEVRAERGES